MLSSLKGTGSSSGAAGKRRFLLALGAIALGFATVLFAYERTPPIKAPRTEADIEALLERMTLAEKVGQLNFCRLADTGEEQVRAGKVGGFLNARDSAKRRQLERVAREESRLRIPLLQAGDVIHGYRTIFPIPLGQAASWNPELSRLGARIAAQESAQVGIRWTYAPMVDIARDPRWGRIAESCGEDPFLAGSFGAAMVRGFQGDDLGADDSVAACAKHFAGYGASEGGRDYNTVDLSERTLREIYLAPFKACADAGAASMMTAFSSVNGDPVSGNRFLLRQVLRKEWGFQGVVVSDAKSIFELTRHGVAENEKEAARAAIEAGVDSEIISTCYLDHIENLVREGKVSETLVNEAARRILLLKLRLGLFSAQAGDAAQPQPETAPTAARLEAARAAARESLVLLKNEGSLLPLAKSGGPIALIGPFADNRRDQLGCWVPFGRDGDSATPLKAFRERAAGGGPEVGYAKGLPDGASGDTKGFAEAVDLAKRSSVALLFLGEPYTFSGEAHNRAYLTLPGAQSALFDAVVATGTPTVVVLTAGRPLEIGHLLDKAAAVVMAWHPGSMGGPALADVLFGDFDFIGRLPVTWPRTVGQIPVYYNHLNGGRPPFDLLKTAYNDERKPDTSYVSGYLDLPFSPQFPFGYGLGYADFSYEDLRLDAASIGRKQSVQASVRITNRGKRRGSETAQLYVRDLVGSFARPVCELKGFQRVELAPGESKTVVFALRASDLAYPGRSMKWSVEPGVFRVWICRNAAEASGPSAEFVVR